MSSSPAEECRHFELILAGEGGDNEKALAVSLVREFGSVAAALSASCDRQREVLGDDDGAMSRLAGFRATMLHVLRSDIADRPLLTCWGELTTYLHAKLAFSPYEQVLVLHLDAAKALINEQTVSIGNGVSAPVRFREIIAASLSCGSASIILVHNHPSGRPQPSDEDVRLTSRLRDLLDGIGVELLDHLIVAGRTIFSLRRAGLIP